ncbi:CHAT domain-containing protein [Streptomyces sp. NY05-11A]|uniref:CHAT domain-containing protein n=1 Tax=Streptomyces soliscabiei TaxID=588897 RepID=UPI0029B6B68D|nr:CHAT domain-containing protein [Streptomyces sp. NY05-11A]MDX2678274.1 CHAT domain-containing protein [Streptomyces sp. NY05-11A]
MTVSVRESYAWRCEECDRPRRAPVWRIVDARERADVLRSPGDPEGFGPGLTWVDCPDCGARAHIEAPVLVLRPGTTAPALYATSVTELQGDVTTSALALLEQAASAGAFRGDPVAGQVIPLPRRLLPFVLARDLDRDLADPERAARELESYGTPTVANHRAFLQYLAEESGEARVGELLRAVTGSLPDQLAELIRTRPELTAGTRVRDAGRKELNAAVGTPLEPTLRLRQRLLDDLCDSELPPEAVLERYFASLGDFAGDLRARLYTMYDAVRASDDLEAIPLNREALALAGQLGEEPVETELAARLGERLVRAVQAGLDVEPSEALSVLEQALRRLPEGSLQWVEVANNLAAAQHLREDGDRAQCWEAACDLLARATALDRRAHPGFWARIQTNYGLLLADRPGGGSADLTLGIDHIRAGLRERSPERGRVDWSYSLLHLGLLLHRRAESDDVREAERCYRDALRVLRPADAPVLWCRLQCNLADVLLTGDSPDPRGAREAADAVLALDASHPGLVDTGRVTWLLARVADLLDGPGGAESLRLRRAALAATPPLVAPSLHLSLAREVVDALAAVQDWTGAADVAADMLTAVHALYDAQVTASGRRSVLSQAKRVARWAAYLLARAGRPEHAVEAIERGLACELSVVAGRGAVDLAALEQLDPALVHRYRQARERYRSLVAEPPTTPSGGPSGGPSAGFAPVSDAQAAAERAVRTVIEEIRAIPGFEAFLRTTELPDIARAADGTPLAYLVNAPWGSYVLVVRDAPGEPDERGAPDDTPVVRAVPVPEVSSTSIVHLLTLAPDDAGVGLLLIQQFGVLKRRRMLPAALDRLRALAPLLRPVARLLAEDPRHEAVVVPTGLLGQVPLNAVPLGPETDEVLDDIGTLLLAPSAAVYAASRAAAVRPAAPAPRLVAVTDPDGSLPGARSELAEIRTQFEPRGETVAALGSDATVDWLLDHLAEATHLHLGCHGSADIAGRGGTLTLADGTLGMDTLVRRRLPHCRLAVAGACQSGHYEIVETPDEFVGLPAGFLQAGAACVVTSLWQVNDVATALLMTRLYELLAPAGAAPGELPAPALRHTRTWLRRLTWDDLARYTAAHPHLADLTRRLTPPATGREACPFASPVHWAAFTAWGV